MFCQYKFTHGFVKTLVHSSEMQIKDKLREAEQIQGEYKPSSVFLGAIKTFELRSGTKKLPIMGGPEAQDWALYLTLRSRPTWHRLSLSHSPIVVMTVTEYSSAPLNDHWRSESARSLPS